MSDREVPSDRVRDEGESTDDIIGTEAEVEGFLPAAATCAEGGNTY